ncbi:MAG TPA: hypothetical protein VGM91_23365 [Conexibacter sp.]|jgi:hypothetical protein
MGNAEHTYSPCPWDAPIDTLLELAEYFRLGEQEARRVLADVVDATHGWRDAARSHGIGDSEIGRMERAFEHDQRVAAREVLDVPA